MPSGISGEGGDRTCGGCAACCKVPMIDEPDYDLVKPPFQWCKFCLPGNDLCCSIYTRRPPTCTAFRCLWLDNPATMPHWLRPDRSRVMFVAKGHDDDGRPIVDVWELIPGQLEVRKIIYWMEEAQRRNMVRFRIANIWNIQPDEDLSEEEDHEL